jgi:hypothetical protein
MTAFHIRIAARSSCDLHLHSPAAFHNLRKIAVHNQMETGWLYQKVHFYQNHIGLQVIVYYCFFSHSYLGSDITVFFTMMTL